MKQTDRTAVRRKVTVLLLMLVIPLALMLPVNQARLNYQITRDIDASMERISSSFDSLRVQTAAAESRTEYARYYGEQAEGVLAASSHHREDAHE